MAGVSHYMKFHKNTSPKKTIFLLLQHNHTKSKDNSNLHAILISRGPLVHPDRGGGFKRIGMTVGNPRKLPKKILSHKICAP